MAYNKFIKKDGSVLLDLTTDTIVADKLAKGITAHDRAGNAITGTYESVTLEYYNGEVTVSGGETLISFTIGGTSYQAESGMTWTEWVESSYNTDGFYIYVSGVNSASGLHVNAPGVWGDLVDAGEEIIPNGAYGLYDGSN